MKRIDDNYSLYVNIIKKKKMKIDGRLHLKTNNSKKQNSNLNIKKLFEENIS